MNQSETDSIIAALERAPAIIVPLVREVPPAILKRRPAPGVWSVHENACHLAEVHAVFLRRLDLMLSGPHPVIKPYSPDVDQEEGALLKADLETELARYVRDRQRLVARLRQLTPEQWQITAEHPEYSHYSMFVMFRHLALHDMAHAYSIEELLLKRDWS
jgi:hypothetical protein